MSLTPSFTFVETLIHQYGEPHRKFHTMEHLSYLFKRLKEFADDHELERSDLKIELDHELMFWCITLHDLIYVPGAADNESKSAEIAKDYLALHGYEQADMVSEIILATKDHKLVEYPESATKLGFHKQLMIDLDLSGIASSPEEWGRTSGEIRDEFVPVVGLEAYEKGRPAWCKSVLDRPRIYGLEYFHQKCEAQARVNLAMGTL